ncbi:MAG: hypothetical protein A2745_01895 [Candidatus Harrisonbacteria bacterium RIFCSPHIGHO2_01_FULL_44_13]|uniref:Non-canonical purine NTP pyrophosphatase n=1 Tax=Candidatus Harrisonbacteria bacterium RIFCSPLOWO2_01_FULL_44_18 TaxID=1798407 RepID=A0A1G1ZNS0_9BACT|nr:MAG: hypothetical protein A2745_01895 [Candidatus Harrisonbacteria bacterium RIFCSPHIGHO2_01_FULL_44_13]OGY66313.1 MAG: hypothetical protein A3A16_00170 [Candidatus Harrisonbacteria bacterium RIFCSPLOWO2_01_FULL_44_18]
MKQLLIATTNPGKAKEMSDFLKDFRISCRFLTDFPDAPSIEETGKTFEENAILKAKGYYAVCGIPTLADDGGLEIDALGGEPGVRSRRWIGREMTDWGIVDHILAKIKDVPRARRSARLRTVVAFFDGVECVTESESLSGYIVEERPKEVRPGYPFRSLLFIPRFGKLFKDLTNEEHDLANHRLKALKRLKPIIENKLSEIRQ